MARACRECDRCPNDADVRGSPSCSDCLWHDRFFLLARRRWSRRRARSLARLRMTR